MLNDKKRNEAYRKAILSSISPKYNKVIDIGSGSGILSLFASQSEHIDVITTIEESRILCEITKKVLAKNGTNKIHVINQNSKWLTKPISNISNVLITEIFDTALFGEHALCTFIHALENLLDKDCRIVPLGADFCITGVSYETDSKNKHIFMGSVNSLNLNDVIVIATNNEPYDAEILNNHNVKYLTETYKKHVDFTNVTQLKQLRDHGKIVDFTNLRVIKHGMINCFAVWFDLHLTEDVVISTSPFNEDSVKCWEQALFWLDYPINAKEGDQIGIEVTCVNNKLFVETNQDKESTSPFFTVSEAVLASLNDEKYLGCMERIASEFEEASTRVFFDGNSFPIFGLLMAKKNGKVYWITDEDGDEALIRYICEKNNLSDSNFVVVRKDNDFGIFCEVSMIFDVVFLNPVLTQGLLNEKQIGDLNLFKALVKENGTILPSSVNLCFKIVESDYLVYCNKVDDRNTLGLKIANVFNEYSLPEHYYFDRRSFPHRELSGKIVCFNVVQSDEEPIVIEYEVEIINGGDACAVLYWFKINYLDGVVIETCESTLYHCVAYLFDEVQKVVAGEKICIVVKQHKGLLKVSLRK